VAKEIELKDKFETMGAQNGEGNRLQDLDLKRGIAVLSSGGASPAAGE